MIVGNKLLLIAIALPLVTLLVIGTKTYENIISFQQQTKFIEETHKVILSLQNLLTLIINAETGQRGFIITGNETYLEPYTYSLNNLNSTIVRLEKLIDDEHSDLLQNAKLNIYPLLRGKISQMEKSLDTMRTHGFNASAEMILSDEGRILMDQIRNNISLIINEEEKILQNKTNQSVVDGQNLLFIYIIGIVISITITTVAIILTYSQLDIKHKQITKLLKIEIDKKTKALQHSNISLKQLNEELKRQDIMQKEFINIAAHELRTPVQSIVGYLEMVKSFPENFKKYLEPLERNSERLYRLTEDILDIARIESNNLNLNKEKFDINQIIKESIDELANKIRNEKKNEFKLICLDESSQKYSTRDKELFVYADKNRIQQVISNMLNNA
ncbi:MAG TPA: CHASE3 domain-containing protein, partial [Nitrososphaeraceae archaeon]